VPDRAGFLAELADREAIRDCLMRYCRGVDRCDLELLRGVYWPDALDSHAVPGKPALDAYYFVQRIMPMLAEMHVTMHHSGNVLIRLDGSKAAVESYFWAVHQETRNGELQDVHAAGRYLDRFERRGDEWRIAHRHVLIDWFRVGDKASPLETGIFGRPSETGDRFGRDMSNRFFAGG
jgi:ketosteroid isomerase-like protein